MFPRLSSRDLDTRCVSALVNPARILVVDDDPDVVSTLKAVLEILGYDVPTALDGVEALEVASRQSTQLVITDIAMPKMDGVALCIALKADPLTAHIPIIVHSARHELPPALKLCVEAFLRKPASMDEFEQLVRVHLP